MSEQSSII
jgi:alpha-tubulin suppressor-like RCC1 family protein